MLGWGVLTLMVLSWATLVVWVQTDPCTFDCGDRGRGRVAALLWFLSLAAVPVGTWLLKVSFEADDEIGRESVFASLASKLLCLFALTMLLAGAYAGFHLLKNLTNLATGCCNSNAPIAAARTEWAAGATFSGAGVIWFGFIGISTFVGARKLDAVVTAGPSATLLWVTAGWLALVTLGGLLVSGMLPISP